MCESHSATAATCSSISTSLTFFIYLFLKNTLYRHCTQCVRMLAPDYLCLGTCVSSRQGAKNTGMLRGPVINLHNVIESGLEEGELAEDN